MQRRWLPNLPRHNRRLLLRTLCTVAGLRLMLWLAPYRVWRPWLERAPRRVANVKGPRPSVSRVAWAVDRTCRFVPGASCLTQALATQRLLSRYGYESQMRIGVARNDTGVFEAHAWVEHNEEIVIGGTAVTLARYVVLPMPGGRHA